MRRTIAYHEWATTWWSSQADLRFADRPDYHEGTRAYALRQSSIRSSMRRFCQHSWRYVRMWVCLGTDDDSPMPTLESMASSVSEDAFFADDTSSVGGISMPSLESLTPSTAASASPSVVPEDIVGHPSIIVPQDSMPSLARPERDYDAAISGASIPLFAMVAPSIAPSTSPSTMPSSSSGALVPSLESFELYPAPYRAPSVPPEEVVVALSTCVASSVCSHANI